MQYALEFVLIFRLAVGGGEIKDDNHVAIEAWQGAYTETACLREMKKVHKLKHDNFDAACIPIEVPLGTELKR